MTDADDPHVLSRQTTPTWEVELLISGVAVFAMLQLPGWLDDRMFALEPRLSQDWQVLLMLSYFYAKSAAVVLACTFALHLLLRAQWIALVGMHSVYPQGVRMERLRMGPIQRAIEEARGEHTADAIERADNRASVAFAIGVSVAFVLAFVSLFFCGALLLVKLGSQAAGLRFDPFIAMAAIFGTTMLPFVAAILLDQAIGARLSPAGLAHRTIAAILRFYSRAGMGRNNNRIIAMLASNGGERRVMGLVIGVMVAAITGVSTTYVAMRSSDAIGSYRHFPDSQAARIDPAHYDDQRDPARDGTRPYVQSAVVAGPYLRLVVPYRPDRDEPAMRAQCPQPPVTGGEALAAVRLACLQAMRGVDLDGKPLADLRYEIASDPRTDRPALLAMIDVRALAPGRHELRIARPLRADRKQDDDDPGFDVIPFWR